jgi:ubiquitin carboxyl-terminal hydrolase 8
MLQCLECNTKSYKFETFMYLSLPLQEQESTLLDCINQYLQDELLDEDNSWFCPKCKKISKS